MNDPTLYDEFTFDCAMVCMLLQMLNQTYFHSADKIPYTCMSYNHASHKDYSKWRGYHPEKKYQGIKHYNLAKKGLKNVTIAVTKLLLCLFGYAWIQAWNIKAGG